MTADSPCIKAGKNLQARKDDIIDHWEKLVKDVITNSKHESSLILQDHLPELLDQLIRLLAMGEIKLDEIEFGKAHGFQRAILTKFSLTDLLTEYSLLRETLLVFLYPMEDLNCSKQVHKFLDILQKHAIVEFLADEGVKISLNGHKSGNEYLELKTNPVIETH